MDIKSIDFCERPAVLLPEEKLDLWNSFNEAVDSQYDVDRLWGKGFGEWLVEYKYRRGGKTLCTFYARENFAVVLIIFGRDEREKLEAVRGQLSAGVQKIYDDTEVLHDGKWVMFPLGELTNEELFTLLRIKRRPNRKSV